MSDYLTTEETRHNVRRAMPTINLGTCYREASLDPSTIDEESRTVSLSYSSEYPVERSFGFEVLDHSPGAADLTRLQNKGPVLLDHDSRQLVGVVEQAEIQGKRGVAKVRFSRNPEGEKVFTDVKDGIRNHVSFGYRVKKMVPEGDRDGMASYRVTSYEPLEISMVGVPADPTVGVGRSYEVQIEERSLPMSEPNSNPPPDFNAEAERARIRLEVVAEHNRKQEQLATRNREIDAISEKWKKNPTITRLADEFRAGDKPLAEFQQRVYDEITRNPEALSVKPSEGMSRKDLNQWSLVRAIHGLTSRDGLTGFEKEMSDEVAKRTGRSTNGFFIPSDVLYAQKRALEVGTFTGAGALVETTTGGQSLIELLRNSMAVVEMGARTLAGLQGDVDIPRQTGGGTAYWLSESGTVTAADQTVGQLALRPHRLAAATAFSKQLITQSTPDVESFVRQDLMQVLAIAKDLACLRGTGVSGQPLGIINTTGLATSPTTSTASDHFTWVDAVAYETNVESGNALTGSLGYLMYPTAKRLAKTTNKDPNNGGSGFVWENGNINGYKAMSTNQLTSGAGGVVYGNWADLIVADWDGMDVLVDPYSLSTTGQVRVIIQTLTDVGIRHAESFCISSA